MAQDGSKFWTKVWFAVFILAGLWGLVFVFTRGYFSSEARQLRKQMKMVEEWENKYKNDTFGGSTPEETLTLFIDALKKGDTDLAAKYFVLDKQEEWRSDLSKIAEKGLLPAMVGDLERTELSIKNNSAFFSLIDENKFVVSELVMHKNTDTGRWKITEL